MSEAFRLLEKVESESKEGAETFGELSPELQEELDKVLFGKSTAIREVANIKERLMGKITDSELLKCIESGFQKIKPLEKLFFREDFIGTLLKYL